MTKYELVCRQDAIHASSINTRVLNGDAGNVRLVINDAQWIPRERQRISRGVNGAAADEHIKSSFHTGHQRNGVPSKAIYRRRQLESEA
jgi:hypothetical protein